MDLIQKTRDDYNKIASHFAQTRQREWTELNQFKPFITDGQHILDWGCGAGRLLEIFKDKAIFYFGLDQSQGLLKIAKKEHVAEMKSGKAKFFCTAHKEKKFAENSLDNVFMIASFHHLPDEKSRLRLLKKTLQEMKPGGHLIITVWNLESKWAKKKLIKKCGSGWKKLGDNDYLIPWKNQDRKVLVERFYHHFSEKEIVELLSAAGFKVLPLEKFNAEENKGADGRNLIIVAQK